ncbi:MAG: DUF6457 domain-containing protein [Haloechinothrix sp.]
MNQLQEWASALCSDLGIEAKELDCEFVLAMARDAGYAVARPAAPITVYLVGIAVARGLSPAEAAQRLGALTRRWQQIDWRD